MAIEDNKATAIGDVIVIQAEVPITGLIGLTDYIDNVTGETASRLFKKTFRYSLTGGVTWSDFYELTTSNLQGIQVNVKDIFRIEYYYERIGSDETGDISFDNINLDSEYIYQENGAQYESSIFSEFFNVNDTRVLAWAINMTNKLYGQGIVPEYFIRGKTELVEDDRDYIDFWGTVAHYFALHVYYAREFQNFRDNPKLLNKYLTERGMYLCNNTPVADMLYLMTNYHAEIAKRGTYQIVTKKSNGFPVNGELLRLVCYQEECDEFVFGYLEDKYRGTCIGNSSPLYRGTKNDPVVNKKIIASSIGNGNNLINNTDRVYTLSPTDTSETGLETGIITISPNLNYEVSFTASQSLIESVIDVTVEAFNENGDSITLRKLSDLSETNIFTENSSFNIQNKDYFCRFLLFNSSEDYKNIPVNIGFGDNLKSVDDVCNINVKIETSGTSVLSVKDLKIKIADTSYSTGFLNSNNIIESWIENNNANYNFEKIYSIIRRYLINYNSPLLLTDINK